MSIKIKVVCRTHGESKGERMQEIGERGGGFGYDELQDLRDGKCMSYDGE